MTVPDWLVLAIAITTLSGNTIALIIGMARFKNWLQKAVVEPYIKPIKEDQQAMKAAAEADRKMLHEHDRFIYVLLGKEFGGVPDLELKNRTVDVNVSLQQPPREGQS